MTNSKVRDLGYGGMCLGQKVHLSLGTMVGNIMRPILKRKQKLMTTVYTPIYLLNELEGGKPNKLFLGVPHHHMIFINQAS